MVASPQTSFGVRLSRIHLRNECVTNETQRTSAGRLDGRRILTPAWLAVLFGEARGEATRRMGRKLTLSLWRKSRISYIC